ncbi:MAG: N-acetylmuramoyl-L-alanine amidase [Muribaculaceae bacterium]|nr:N-acetylmuramoyl-L-alanine amidase [Muribaculaceae bacterium]
MKKSIVLLLALACIAGAEAKGLKGKTIYLNPGHGGYTTGDRPTATINHEYMDTLSFYETRSNLWKAQEVAKHLRQDGAKVIMSRTRSGYVTLAQMEDGILNENQESHAIPSEQAVDTRFNQVETTVDENGQQQIVGLERIACQVDSIKPDYFLSMHSNAHVNGSTINYLLMLYRGETDKPYYKHSDEMARAMWPYAFDNPLSTWSHYSPEKMAVVGDISWMGGTPPGTPNRTGATGYYAVLKFNAPGFLVEGSFHTYDPERQRLLNRDYCRLEGLRYYRGIRAYFKGKPEKVGYLAGTVKSATEVMDHPRYKYREGSDDQWKPINYAMVYLMDSHGVTIRTYRTDGEWNGVFAFFGLKPGKYTLRYEANGYVTKTEKVEVKADKTTYVLPKLELKNE